MPDRDQGWQKARDQGCIVDMPRGQRWQTAMEQMDQAQDKQNCHWTKQPVFTHQVTRLGQQLGYLIILHGNAKHQTAVWRFGATPPGKGVASLLQVYPRMPPLSSSTASNPISGRHCVFTWDNTCCSYTAGYTVYYTCVHGRRWHVQVAAFTTADCTTSKAIICSKRWLHRDEVCFRGRQRVCVAMFFSGGKRWHPAQPRLKLESSQFWPHYNQLSQISWLDWHICHVLQFYFYKYSFCTNSIFHTVFAACSPKSPPPLKKTTSHNFLSASLKKTP